MAVRSMMLAMPYQFETDDHVAVRSTARRFAQAHIAPHGAAWEEAEELRAANVLPVARVEPS